MKNLVLLTMLITLTITGFSQSQRLVLLEHFTQASCGPCAGVNPGLHTLLTANPDKITSIMYHTSWPGYDPMYNHNTVDAGARTSYYVVQSVPNSVLDGNYYNGHPNGWNINTVNTRYAVPSPFNLSINQQLSAGNDTLFVTMLIEATSDISGPLSAFMTVIEKHIHFNTAPGSNGEKDFYNVMKKLLPSKTGISLPTPMVTGDYVILQSYWLLANVYSIPELSVVGFVQNPISKEVHQSANLSLQAITALHNNDVELTAFTNMVDKYCKTEFSPKILICNNGNSPLTSLDIKYQVNDDELLTYSWTGNLPFLGKYEIELPQMDFDLLAANTLKVYVDQVNQVTDEYHKNDTLIHNFTPAIQASRDILVKIRTDNFPEEITWVIADSNGEVVFSGGPYTEAGTVYNEVSVLPYDDCYEFRLFDSGGNGLCCSNGSGFYTLKSGSVTISQGTQFGAEAFAQFDVVSVGTENISPETGFVTYPNPASETVFIEFTADPDQEAKIIIYNPLGQVVYRYDISARGGADQKLEINTRNWNPGFYMIRFENGNEISNRKVTVGK
ncbi:MAG: T9SS type A sorting domain-containing protein [Bacteroidota bacterium]